MKSLFFIASREVTELNVINFDRVYVLISCSVIYQGFMYATWINAQKLGK